MLDVSHYEVVEYSNEGFGRLPDHFITFEEAVDWVNQAQKNADSFGNVLEVFYDVIPVAKTVYRTFSTAAN